MTQPIPCSECGALILPETAERTGGVCMKCAREGPPKPAVEPSFPVTRVSAEQSRTTAARILWRKQHPAYPIFYRDVNFLPDREHLLVSAGHGQPYVAIRSRRLDIESGEEVDAASLGDRLRCFYASADSGEIIGCTNRRLVVFARGTVLRQYRKAVPQYVKFVLPLAPRAVLLGSDSSLGTYDLQAETIRRHNLPSCEGLFGTADGLALVCAGKTGELFSVSTERPKPQRIGRLQPFREARESLRASLVWLSLKLVPRSPNVVLRCDLRAKD